MEANIVTDISPAISYLEKFWFSSYGPKCCQPIKLQDSLNVISQERSNKHRSLLQGDAIILGVCNQACPKRPK